jgi:hypothetical protein
MVGSRSGASPSAAGAILPRCARSAVVSADAVAAATWFSSRTDPAHIAARGFDVELTRQSIHLIDPDVEAPDLPVLRSAWGLATRSSRLDWPYDFSPTLYAGVQLWDQRELAVPATICSLVGPALPAHGRGAYVSPDKAPLSDTLEFVFLPDPDARTVPDQVLMAQVLLDLAPSSLSPYADVARRVLEPVLRDLKTVVDELADHDVAAIADLRNAVAGVESNLRTFQAQPSRLRRALMVSLGALGSIVLGLVSTRLDPLVDQVDWPRLLAGISDALERLGIG